MPFEWIPPLLRFSVRAIKLWWNDTGFGWESVVVSVILFAAGIFFRSRTLYKASNATSWKWRAMLGAVRDSVKPTWESKLTKIGLAAWVILVAIAVVRTGLEYRSNYLSIVSQTRGENLRLTSENSRKPTVVTDHVQLPPDPSLLKAGTILGVVLGLKQSFSSYPLERLVFVVTSSTRNATAKADVEALIHLACGDDHVYGYGSVCNIETEPPDQTVPVYGADHGIVIRSHEPSLAGRPLLADAVVGRLSQLYVVSKSAELFSDSMITHYQLKPETRAIHINIGASPWYGKVAMRDGVSRLAMAAVYGRKIPLKDEISTLSVKIADLYKARYGHPFDPSANTSYLQGEGLFISEQYVKPLARRVLTLIGEAKMRGVDVGDVDSVSLPKTSKELWFLSEKLSMIAERL